MSISIALAAGGTGGHLLPALAVADAIKAIRPEASLTVVGSTRHLDRDLLISRGVKAESTDVISFGSRSQMPKAIARLARATRDSRSILSKIGADAVCGFGGYPSLPPMLAAASQRIPRVVHEANALPRLGLANRIAARTGAEVWGGFDSTGSAISKPVRVSGIPIRAEIANLDRDEQRPASRDHFGCASDATVVLIVGGSLGAAKINAAIAELVQRGLPESIHMIWSTGHDQFQTLSDRFRASSNVHLEPYLEKMDLAYAAADAVVSRAGASTVAELETVGCRAVLVPLGVARSGEQDLNANTLIRRGSAAILRESDLDADSLMRVLQEVLGKPQPDGNPRHAVSASLLAARLVELAEGSR